MRNFIIRIWSSGNHCCQTQVSWKSLESGLSSSTLINVSGLLLQRLKKKKTKSLKISLQKVGIKIPSNSMVESQWLILLFSLFYKRTKELKKVLWNTFEKRLIKFNGNSFSTSFILVLFFLLLRAWHYISMLVLILACQRWKSKAKRLQFLPLAISIVWF